MRVGIALGSNLGDRIGHLRTAVKEIRAFAGDPIRLSDVYETEPVDCPAGSPGFLNAVIEIDYTEEPLTLLAKLQEVEHAHGRPKVRARNAPRALDLDLLYMEDRSFHHLELELPHPRLAERAFVLLPLRDVAPDLILPGTHDTVESLAALQMYDGIKKSQYTLI